MSCPLLLPFFLCLDFSYRSASNVHIYIYVCVCVHMFLERDRRFAVFNNFMLAWLAGVSFDLDSRRARRRREEVSLCMLYVLPLPQRSIAVRIRTRPTTIGGHGVIEGAPQARSRRRPTLCRVEAEEEGEKKMTSTDTDREDALSQRLIIVGLTGSIGRREKEKKEMCVCIVSTSLFKLHFFFIY